MQIEQHHQMVWRVIGNRYSPAPRISIPLTKRDIPIKNQIETSRLSGIGITRKSIFRITNPMATTTAQKIGRFKQEKMSLGR